MIKSKRSNLEEFALFIRRTLNHPRRVFYVCLFFLGISILLNGSLFRLWGLHRDLRVLDAQMRETILATERLDLQLKQAKDPAFIERQARDKLDMVNEDDLVFVFSDGP